MWDAAAEREHPALSVTFNDLYLPTGTFATEGVYVVTNGSFSAGGTGPSSESDAYVLAPNYPNPFSTTTTIRYGLPEAARVRLDIYDVLGRRVVTLADGEQEAGWHEAQFRAESLAAGVYFCVFHAGEHTTRRQMLLVR